jgi:hypothetical protein
MIKNPSHRTDTYYEQMYYDVCEYIADCVNIADYIEDGEMDVDRMIEEVNEACWTEDSVTGNVSGSYYCNAYKAKEQVFENIELLIEALESFGCEAEDYKRALVNPEWADVTIRCYYLYEVVNNVIEAIEEAYNEAGAGVELSKLLEAVKGA